MYHCIDLSWEAYSHSPTQPTISPAILNMNVHAVVPGMGDTFPLLAMQVYSPASDSCTSVSLSVERVTFPSSLSGPPLVVITRWSVTFGSRTMPSFSQVTSGGEDP